MAHCVLGMGPEEGRRGEGGREGPMPAGLLQSHEEADPIPVPREPQRLCAEGPAVIHLLCLSEGSRQVALSAEKHFVE